MFWLMETWGDRLSDPISLNDAILLEVMITEREINWFLSKISRSKWLHLKGSQKWTWMCKSYIVETICTWNCILIHRRISMNAEWISSCTGTCWCSILISATSLWSSSCSLLSSSQACFTWLCSLTSWMLSCLTASSSSFSWPCSLAIRLCSVLRRYQHKYHQTVAAASRA